MKEKKWSQTYKISYQSAGRFSSIVVTHETDFSLNCVLVRTFIANATTTGKEEEEKQ